MSTNPQQVAILYKNWRGETAWRRILPVEVYFGSNEFHPQPQWLLRALDADKLAERHFAIADIQQWLNGIPAPPSPPARRILREGSIAMCPVCGSSASKKFFFFGRLQCHNKFCSNV